MYRKLEFGMKVFNAPTNESTPTKKCLKKITLEEEEYCEVLDACEKRKKSFGTRAQVDLTMTALGIFFRVITNKI